MSPKARDRARAKRRYAKRQATLAQRAQARRTRQQVTAAVLSVLVVVGGIFAVTHFVGGSSGKKSASPGASSTPTSTATTPTGATCPKATPAKVAKRRAAGVSCRWVRPTWASQGHRPLPQRPQ